MVTSLEVDGVPMDMIKSGCDNSEDFGIICACAAIAVICMSTVSDMS